MKGEKGEITQCLERGCGGQNSLLRRLGVSLMHTYVCVHVHMCKSVCIFCECVIVGLCIFCLCIYGSMCMYLTMCICV